MSKLYETLQKIEPPKVEKAALDSTILFKIPRYYLIVSGHLASLKSVRDGAIYTKLEDRDKAAQILKWALEELESSKKELSDTDE